MKFFNKKSLTAVGAVIVGVGLLTSCSASTSPDMIAFVVGDGQSGNDASVHEIIYPGSSASEGSGEDIYYVPAGNRNYVLAAATGRDRNTPATGLTKNGTPVNVFLETNWTLNQSYDVLKDKFYPFCRKFLCASTDPNERNTLSATDGWVKMLNETFSPAIDDAVRTVMPKYDDNIWKTQSQEIWDDFAADVSQELTIRLRKRTGYTDDLFCGPGDASGWSGTEGKNGKFSCGPINVIITSVTSSNKQQQESENQGAAAEQQLEANRKILEAAIAKYGDPATAGNALAAIDIINACKAQGVTCVVSVNGSGDGAPSVSIVPPTDTDTQAGSQSNPDKPAANSKEDK